MIPLQSHRTYTFFAAETVLLLLLLLLVYLMGSTIIYGERQVELQIGLYSLTGAYKFVAGYKYHTVLVVLVIMGLIATTAS